MNPRDPELTRLLILELERHRVGLETETELSPDNEAQGELTAARRAVHALKGSAGLAGEPELADALKRLERRLREGDHSALSGLVEVIEVAIQRLKSGESAVYTAWPSPPDGIVALPVSATTRAYYVAEVKDRLARIDEALGTIDDPIEAAAALFRHLHTLKGAASALGDEPMSWFCHGLEERIQGGGATRESALAAMHEVARWRAVLGGLLDDSENTLGTLEATHGLRRPKSAPAFGQFPPRPAPPPVEDPSRAMVEEATVRVSAASVDRLLERFTALGAAREQVSARGESAREGSRIARRARNDLVEALRLVGPPRPWGVPVAALRRIHRAVATLLQVGDELEHTSNDLRTTAQSMKEGVSDAKVHLSAMRQTPMRRTFARLAMAVEAEASRSSRLVVVRTYGGEETIDRRLAEALLEPCLQLARNAVAHGIEPPSARLAAGKPEAATITLRAVKVGSRLRVTIADDGAGVDVAALRDQAVASGTVNAALAEAADDETLLALLFLPGFSLHDGVDLLAGRGIGLDIALRAVQRLGGAIRLSSTPNHGFAATLELPIESGLATVLWVKAGGEEHALLAASARRVRRTLPENDGRLAHLAACLEARPNEPADYAIEFDVEGEGDGRRRALGSFGGGTLVVGVDAVGRSEEVLVRPLTALVAGMGPYAGAVAAGDGRLRLAIDPFALAPRVRALGRVPDGRASDFPSRPPPSFRP